MKFYQNNFVLPCCYWAVNLFCKTYICYEVSNMYMFCIRFSNRYSYWPNRRMTGPKNLDKTGFLVLSGGKNPAYGRHWISWLMQIVSPLVGMGGREGERTNEKPGTDHVISGPMRGLEKLHLMAQADRQTDKRTWRLYDWIGPVGKIQSHYLYSNMIFFLSMVLWTTQQIYKISAITSLFQGFWIF